MILLIPLGGLGNRFKKAGYKQPKALINIEGKPILFHLLDNINYSKIDYVYIVYNKEYADYDIETIIKNKYIDIIFKFLKLEKDTEGALETISIALKKIKNKDDKPIICVDGDNFYTTDILSLWNGKNAVITFTDHDKTDNKFSYILKDDDNIIKDIKEKELFENQITSFACTGAYGFASYKELLRTANKILNDNFKVKNEYYISSAIKYMINDNISFKNITIDNKYYFSLGTPEQVRKYEYIFLFDLDGTLIDTDELYFEIWKELLKEYNIIVDIIYYKKIIKGKSDKNFLQSIIPNITDNKIKEISFLKDKIFINKIDKIKIYDGVIDFLKQLINSRTAIVTNCNKTAVLEILKYYNISQYINKIISTDDIVKTKPDKEPYVNAIKFIDDIDFNRYKYENNILKDYNKCIVFEDSYIGYLSAKNAGIENIYIKMNEPKSEMSLLNTEKFKNYNDINADIIINDIERRLMIKESFNIPINKIKDVTIKTGGYICDIVKYNLLFENNNKLNIIMKISNNDSSLSKTAKELDLYENEKYFYNYISSYVFNTINIPACYNVIDTKKTINIILEDLTDMKGEFNINLNKNINILMKVIEEIAKLHINHYYKGDEELPSYLLNVKKINEYTYYKQLINERFDDFIINNEKYLSPAMKDLFISIKKDYENIINNASVYPLSLCHGDLKSLNIFYKDNMIPYFLDFQYINLNKSVSDIIFLLVESIEFDKILYEDTINYYYKILIANNISYDYDIYRNDIKNALCIFPFFVCIWFNTEDKNNLVDKNFPSIFMNKLIKYYNYEFGIINEEDNEYDILPIEV
jgi:beta-phosphoglucomutase-like phosphatase (HAD superfamily)/tRNA A-37 threonylcarbamoyl transferase component Bud32